MKKQKNNADSDTHHHCPTVMKEWGFVCMVSITGQVYLQQCHIMEHIYPLYFCTLIIYRTRKVIYDACGPDNDVLASHHEHTVTERKPHGNWGHTRHMADVSSEKFHSVEVHDQLQLSLVGILCNSYSTRCSLYRTVNFKQRSRYSSSAFSLAGGCEGEILAIIIL